MDVFNVFDNELYLKELVENKNMSLTEAKKYAAEMFFALVKAVEHFVNYDELQLNEEITADEKNKEKIS